MMTRYLRQVLKERRGHMPLADVSPHVGLRESNLSRFESGKLATLDRLDKIVEGYAEALGVEPRELWWDALERWDAVRYWGEKDSPSGRRRR